MTVEGGHIVSIEFAYIWCTEERCGDGKGRASSQEDGYHYDEYDATYAEFRLEINLIITESAEKESRVMVKKNTAPVNNSDTVGQREIRRQYLNQIVLTIAAPKY